MFILIDFGLAIPIACHLDIQIVDLSARDAGREESCEPIKQLAFVDALSKDNF